VHFAEATGVSQTGQDIGALKPRMAGQNLCDAVARAQIREPLLHDNPCVANHRLPVGYSGNDFDAVNGGATVCFPLEASRFLRSGPSDVFQSSMDTNGQGFAKVTQSWRETGRSRARHDPTVNQCRAAPCVRPSGGGGGNERARGASLRRNTINPPCAALRPAGGLCA
jgi:hypothetical protein